MLTYRNGAWGAAPAQGGGLLPQALVTTKPGASVTATLGETTVGPVIVDEDGLAVLDLTDYGAWTLTATLDDRAGRGTLEVTDVMQYSVTLTLSNIPRGYTELEYIGNSADGAYINTGLKLNGYRAEFDYMGISSAKDWPFFLGCGTSGTADGDQVIDNYSGLRVYFSKNARTNSASLNVKYHLEINWIPGSTYAKIDGKDFSGSTDTDSGNRRTDMPILIFGFALAPLNTTTPTYQATKSKVRFYGALKIYSGVGDDTLVGWYYPARRDSDGTVGMYDTVTDTFFVNSGTGSFIAGPEV